MIVSASRPGNGVLGIVSLGGIVTNPAPGHMSQNSSRPGSEERRLVYTEPCWGAQMEIPTNTISRLPARISRGGSMSRLLIAGWCVVIALVVAPFGLRGQTADT